MTTLQLVHMDGYATLHDLEQCGILLKDEEGVVRISDGSLWQWRPEHGLYELIIC